MEGDCMEFVTVRDFRSGTANLWDKLARDGKMVVTNNGRPTALMINILNQDFEAVLDSIKQAEFVRTVNDMRSVAAAHGYMTDDEINVEIQTARAERKKQRQQP
jgi:antitoxin (DNA-binding transcriptional repressor) of toxin-antitoxin stability system